MSGDEHPERYGEDVREDERRQTKAKGVPEALAAVLRHIEAGRVREHPAMRETYRP